MELSECVELVKNNTRIDEHDRSQNGDIYVLADRLGRLPLALAQAAAYIARQAVSVRTYIDAYERLLVQRATASLPTGDPHEIVAITWDVTMSVLRTEMEKRTPPLPPLGHILLTVCAYLAPDAIPRSLLQRWLDVAYPDLPVGVDLCSVLLGLLRDYSLIQYVDAEKQAVKIHRVLRTVVKHQHETVEPEHQPRNAWYPLPGLPWLTTVLLAMNAEYDREWERIIEKETFHRQLLPHLDLLASSAPATDALVVGGMKVADAFGCLLRNLGDVFLCQLGQYGPAQIYLLKALPIFEAIYGPHHVQVAVTLANLGNAYMVLGDYVKAKALLERALAANEAANGPQHVVATTLASLGNVYDALGDFVKAKALLERALAINETAYGKHHVEVAATLTNLGNAYGSLGDYRKKKLLLERALVIDQATYGPHHVKVATTLMNLGNAYMFLGDYLKAIEVLERALEINEAAYGLYHIAVAHGLTNLGNVYGSLGDYHMQKSLLERALVIQQAAYGPQHVKVAVILNCLGNAYGFLGDYRKKQVLLQRALVIDEAAYGLHHVHVAVTLANLGNAYMALGDYVNAIELLKRALLIFEAAYGLHHAQVATTMSSLGSAYGKVGDYRKKKELLERALTSFEATYGLHHVEVAKVLGNLGNAYGSLGDHIKQKELIERALTMNEAMYGPHHVNVAVTLMNLGNAYGCLGNHYKARALLERALVIDEATYGPYHVEVAATLTNLSSAYGAFGDHPKQKELLERALGICEATYGPNHVEVAEIMHYLGNACMAWGDYCRARELLRRAAEIFEAAYGLHHDSTAATLTSLGVACQHLDGTLRECAKQQGALDAHLPVATATTASTNTASTSFPTINTIASFASTTTTANNSSITTCTQPPTKLRPDKTILPHVQAKQNGATPPLLDIGSDWFLPAAEAALIEIFNRFDTDSDGQWTLHEMQIFATATNDKPFTTGELYEVMNRFFIDHKLPRQCFLQFYYLQTSFHPAETWKDMQKLGYGWDVKTADILPPPHVKQLTRQVQVADNDVIDCPTVLLSSLQPRAAMCRGIVITDYTDDAGLAVEDIPAPRSFSVEQTLPSTSTSRLIRLIRSEPELILPTASDDEEEAKVRKHVIVKLNILVACQ